MVTKHPQSQFSFATCRSRRAIELFSDKWTILVIAALEQETKRFSQLKEMIDGISQKMLTQTLRDLERNGLVQRVVYPTVPPQVEYTLTPLGRTLFEPINAIRTWAKAHLEEVEQARATFDIDI